MVIQRWQSVLLLVAGVIMGVFAFSSLGQVQLPNMSLNFTVLGFEVEGIATNGAPAGYLFNTWPLLILTALSTILPLVNIFLYRNMRLQKKICLLEILFLLAVIAVAICYGYYSIQGGECSWSSVAMCPFLSLIATYMAVGRIKKDEKLLRSTERIR